MEKKVKLKYFNQCFTTILKKFLASATFVEALTVEYYASPLHPSIGMFVKRADGPTFAQNFEESKEVEKEMFSLGSHPTIKKRK
jgi:hypothetical protein